MAGLDPENVEKKFRGVSATQDNIQSLALWVLHHKAHHEKIVDIWFKVLKKSKMPHRLTLFYLCNDIIQNSKRKHAICYKDQFKEVLKDATLLVRDNSIRQKVERLFTIWQERSVYEKEFTDELTSILNNTKVRATMNSKLLAEFKPRELTDMITKVRRYEDDVELRRRQVSNLRLDASDLEAIKQLKDKSHGQAFLRQFDDSCSKLKEFVSALHKEMKDRAALVELLEQSELFYDAQHGEAKIVANAYKNFGTRVSNQRKKLEEYIKTLPSSSPVVSPSQALDAPSPGNTPPQAMGDDNIEMVDMEMSDDETEAGIVREGYGPRSESTSITRSYPLPIPSVTQIRMKQSDRRYTLGNDNSIEGLDDSPVKPEGSPMASESPKDSYIPGLGESKVSSAASFLGSIMSHLSNDSSSSNSTPKEAVWTPARSNPNPSNQNLVPYTDGENTPVKDEGGGTPVMDENSDSDAGDKRAASSNPIDFLTKLINKSKKSEKSSTANFFQSLSVLAKTMKSTFGEDENHSKDETESEEREERDGRSEDKGGDTWASWKSQQEASPPEPTGSPQESAQPSGQGPPAQLMLNVQGPPPGMGPAPPQQPPGLQSPPPGQPQAMQSMQRPPVPPQQPHPPPFLSPPPLRPPHQQGGPPMFPNANFSVPPPPRPPGGPPQPPSMSGPPSQSPHSDMPWGAQRPPFHQHPEQPPFNPNIPPPGPPQTPPAMFPLQRPGESPRGPPPPPMSQGIGISPQSPAPLRAPPRPHFLLSPNMSQPPPPPSSMDYSRPPLSQDSMPMQATSPISVLGGAGITSPQRPMFPPHSQTGSMPGPLLGHSPPPPNQPPPPVTKAKPDPLTEVQEEFIQKLKRKSSISHSLPSDLEALFPPKKPRPEEPAAAKPEAKDEAEEGKGKEEEQEEDAGTRGSSSLTSVVVVPSTSDTENNKDKNQAASAISTVSRTQSSDAHHPHRDPRRRNSGGERNERRGGEYERRDSWEGSHGGRGGRGPPPPDVYMSERDRWAYEMAKQQYYKDMYGRAPHPRRPPIQQQNYDRSYYPRH